MPKVKKNKLPKFLQSALWSYDLAAFDLNNPFDKKLIIEQVLNFGTEEQVSWVLNNYSKDEIRNALKNPRRGMWYPESLNYWAQVVNVKIGRDVYERAIKNIYPSAQVFKHS